MSLDPVILFFLLGMAAGLAKADLRLPSAIYELLSVLLLLSIGMKGGMAMAGVPLGQLSVQLVAVAVMGLVTGLTAFGLLRLAPGLARSDAASIAAHYGSVSVGTYAVAVAFLAHAGISFEEYVAAFVVVLEVPAILLGIVLARGTRPAGGWSALAGEVFLGKSVVLLLGGMMIGLIAGPAGLEGVAPLFFDAFKGILALFLLEMGLVAAGQLGPARRHGAFLVIFALGMPLIGAATGAAFAMLLDLSLGGALLLTTLGASASYIAAPAAMRMAVPEANPGLSLTASLAVTFPFNVLVGIPLYFRILQSVWPATVA
jgi:uncharacterized protein